MAAPSPAPAAAAAARIARSTSHSRTQSQLALTRCCPFGSAATALTGPVEGGSASVESGADWRRSYTWIDGARRPTYRCEPDGDQQACGRCHRPVHQLGTHRVSLE